MSKTIAALDFLGKMILRITILITSTYIGATLARAEVVAMRGEMDFPDRHNEALVVEQEPEARPSPAVPNDIQAEPMKAEKLEYEPLTDEKPVAESRKSKTEDTGGAIYESGDELYITPESSFSVKDEKIEEKPEQSQQAAAPAAASASL